MWLTKTVTLYKKDNDMRQYNTWVIVELEPVEVCYYISSLICLENIFPLDDELSVSVEEHLKQVVEVKVQVMECESVMVLNQMSHQH